MGPRVYQYRILRDSRLVFFLYRYRTHVDIGSYRTVLENDVLKNFKVHVKNDGLYAEIDLSLKNRIWLP